MSKTQSLKSTAKISDNLQTGKSRKVDKKDKLIISSPVATKSGRGPYGWRGHIAACGVPDF
ncbi:hypothetical protein RCC89_16400 [Cytophagaceae bacterium ABcell3]|nr:hypothetical protein RCC89_16380 [Cytophagaceae bacterium ABcell3]WMJ74733.1 hypothetical protein RCC89_16385 [Cytophagaceae bacterium ABcell3]WMJ74734.1 hypothetical protein RCC89_16390 [Cytophagaceae bacterium ABcell3]WMJ74735.1 hypothetical protein RCC89_16395 [Cytophagaceae bacterium ABcell3]WMJ74736.1 hypothetical protein RCC89_16400 [Cytophagaceae bacterium ABcell3]